MRADLGAGAAAEERAWRKLRLTLSGWPGQRRERARSRGAKETASVTGIELSATRTRP